MEIRHDRLGDQCPRLLQVSHVPGEGGLLSREPAVFVLLGRLVADVGEIGADRAATAIDHVAGVASLFIDQFLAQIDEISTSRLAVVAMADVAVHLHERRFVVDERIRFAQFAAKQWALPILDRTVRLLLVNGVALSAVA